MSTKLWQCLVALVSIRIRPSVALKVHFMSQKLSGASNLRTVTSKMDKIIYFPFLYQKVDSG